MNGRIPVRQHIALLGFALASTLVSGTSFAQTERSGGGANAQALQQLQQLATERTRLQAESATLKGELEKARKERDALKAAQEGAISRSRGTQAELERAVGEKARLQGELAQERSRQQELVARLREAATNLRELESGGAAAREKLARSEQQAKACVDRNARLYELNREVLAKFEDQGFWSALARREPFTQLKRVQLENLVDDYRMRAEEQKTPPSP